MRHTIAVNKQLFNVKSFASAVTLDNLAEGQFGIFAEGSSTSVADTVTFATLPAKFRMISKLGGKVYYSFDTISKDQIRNVMKSAYKAPVVNEWEAIVEHCKCIKTANIKVGLEEESLMRRDGMTWTDTDSSVVEGQNSVCTIDCTGKEVYDNHLITRALYKSVKQNDSPFYEAFVKTESGDVLADLAAIDVFIATNKAANTDEDDSTALSDKLVFGLRGKAVVGAIYKDLDANYINPRGAKLFPSISLNAGEVNIVFTETQELGYEIGAGADLRAEEWESMNYYTNLNHYTQLSDGLASDGLVYQFENGQEYNTVNFEFYTDKVLKNDGDKRSFGVMLATTNAGIFTTLKAIFGA
jgi:hypothetical protein